MSVQRGGDFQLVDFTAGAADYSRTRRQAHCDDDRTGRIIVPHGSDVLLSHGDNEIRVADGQIGLVDMGRAMCVSTRTHARVWAANIPEEYMPTKAFRAGMPLLLNSERASVAAALALLRTVSDYAGALSGSEFTAINSRLMELLNLSLHEQSSDEETRFATRARAAHAHIAERSDDPRLTPSSVAGDLGCSRRQLEYALHTVGAPAPARLIADTRAGRAYRRLIDPYETASISDIAYACGFDTLSTFNRTFSRHFGKPPAQVRRQRSSLR
ncbi:AraC family transcriptional regulator [Nocardia uniformis]|uniref:AraC family transcriptional regulator n=2 Tax=Nocardia uniformis TaxID=53432 RepID=A0A849C479_9NOCA|nr:AraC family transcriptional regulator [Nocardia uniformis]